jgi:hypothetical protein
MSAPTCAFTPSLVAMMEAAEDRNADDLGADLGRLDGPAGGRVLGEAQVRAPRVVVVLLVIAKQAHRVALVEDDDVVE